MEREQSLANHLHDPTVPCPCTITTLGVNKHREITPQQHKINNKHNHNYGKSIPQPQRKEEYNTTVARPSTRDLHLQAYLLHLPIWPQGNSADYHRLQLALRASPCRLLPRPHVLIARTYKSQGGFPGGEGGGRYDGGGGAAGVVVDPVNVNSRPVLDCTMWTGCCTCIALQCGSRQTVQNTWGPLESRCL